MYTLTLEYSNGEGVQRRSINAEHETKTLGKVVIGRDPTNCDFIVTDDTNRVSRQHIEIEHESPKDNYLVVKNLTANRSRPNPVVIDGKIVINKSAKINSGSKIKLRNSNIVIKSIDWHSPKALEEELFGVECINGHRISLKYLNSFCPHCGYAVQSSRTIAK